MPGLAAIGLLLLNATIAIHADEARDLTEARVSALLGDLADAIRRRGESTVINPFHPAAVCKHRDRCAAVILETTQADNILLLRIFSVPSKMRILAELRDREQQVLRRTQFDLGHARELWAYPLEAMALELFPSVASVPAPMLRAQPPPIEGPQPVLAPPVSELEKLEARPPPSDLPWWLISGGALAGGLALALGAENRSARREGVLPGVSAARVDQLEGTAFRTGLAANVLFGVAAAALVGGGLLLLTR